ncbi:hypothetical protein NKG94_24535 [Micromonospora sp. M12]
MFRPKALGGALTALVTVASGVFLAAAVGSSPAVAAGTGTGYLHTNGNQIVDSTGATVRLTGINWFGMETDNKTFHGLWSSNPWRGSSTRWPGWVTTRCGCRTRTTR